MKKIFLFIIFFCIYTNLYARVVEAVVKFPNGYEATGQCSMMSCKVNGVNYPRTGSLPTDYSVGSPTPAPAPTPTPTPAEPTPTPAEPATAPASAEPAPAPTSEQPLSDLTPVSVAGTNVTPVVVNPSASNPASVNSSTTNILGVEDQKLKDGNVDMNTIPLVIVSVISTLLAVAGTVAVFSLIYHAVQMQINSGITGDSSGVDKAKKGMIGALIGFVIAIAAWFLVTRAVELLTNIT